MKTSRVIYDITVIGAGGTGTYFLKEFSRYLAGNDKAYAQIGFLHLLDGDNVERKNLDRQTFYPEDIGMSKSIVMASALNDAFFSTAPVKWIGYNRYVLKKETLTMLESDIKRTNIMRIPVIIGCVDNHAARLLCESYFYEKRNCLYFDAANELTNGEVIFGVRKAGRNRSKVRSRYFPEIKKGDLRTVEEMSCTELNAVSPQHITANMQAGLLLLSGICQVFEENILPTGMAVFDIADRSVTSYAKKEVKGFGR